MQFRFGKYSYVGDYPIKIPLKPPLTMPKRCKNEELLEKKEFYVKKKPKQNGKVGEFTFTAHLPGGEDAISTLNAKTGGSCDHASTPKPYQGCHLAQYLGATCIQDDSILGEDKKGMDIMKDRKWDQEPQRMEAHSTCKTITSLRCFPDADTPKRVCISYLRAASLANFDIVFVKKATRPEKESPMTVWELGEPLETLFGADSDKFVKTYGISWFFCKCKGESNTEKEKCFDMINMPEIEKQNEIV